MRQKEGGRGKDSTAVSVVPGKPETESTQDAGTLNGTLCPPESQSNSSGKNLVEGGMNRNERTGNSGESPQGVPSSETPPHSNVSGNSTTSVGSTLSPIRTGPSPRSPLQPLASSAQEKSRAAWGEDGSSRRRRSSLEPAGTVPFPPSRENWERPSSCCPALLLEGTDLSSYGAKIYKMKDGLIGSALDLIKKRLV